MQTTIKDLAAKLGVEYAAAAGLVHVMIAKGVAKEIGKQANITKTGKACKPSTIYEIPETFVISFGPDLNQSNESLAA